MAFFLFLKRAVTLHKSLNCAKRPVSVHESLTLTWTAWKADHVATRFRHILLSAVWEANSAVSLAPVSRFNMSMYDVLGLPLPQHPFLGSHNTCGCVLSSGWRKHWPVSCILREAILSLIEGVHCPTLH
jgi:hypothetical protein